MESIETVALSKAANGSAKIARSEVDPGSYDVSFYAWVRGSVKVGEDYDTAPTVSIPLKKALAALAHVSGCTGKAGIAKIERAMRIALETDDDAAKILTEMMPQIEFVERSIVTPMIASLPRLDCKGKVTTKLTVTKVEAVCEA